MTAEMKREEQPVATSLIKFVVVNNNEIFKGFLLLANVLSQLITFGL